MYSKSINMTPNRFNFDEKKECNIGRIICVACWAL